jgi:hypothetical protein
MVPSASTLLVSIDLASITFGTTVTSTRSATLELRPCNVLLPHPGFCADAVTL